MNFWSVFALIVSIINWQILSSGVLSIVQHNSPLSQFTGNHLAQEIPHTSIQTWCGIQAPFLKWIAHDRNIPGVPDCYFQLWQVGMSTMIFTSTAITRSLPPTANLWRTLIVTTVLSTVEGCKPWLVVSQHKKCVVVQSVYLQRWKRQWNWHFWEAAINPHHCHQVQWNKHGRKNTEWPSMWCRTAWHYPCHRITDMSLSFYPYWCDMSTNYTWIFDLTQSQYYQNRIRRLRNIRTSISFTGYTVIVNPAPSAI